MQSLVKRGEGSSNSRAVELLTRQLNGIENKGQLILKSLLPNLPNVLGVFSRPPPNIVRIILDFGEAGFQPGDTVSGTIRAMLSEPVAVDHISVTLDGTAYAKVIHGTAENPRSCFLSDIKLFEASQEITPETRVLAPKRYEWPFTLTIPKACSLEELPFNENTRNFDSDLCHPLPPSFRSKNPRARSNHGRITYQIQARLVSKKETSTKIRHALPIILQTVPLIPASLVVKGSLRQRCTFTQRSALLNPAVVTERPSTPKFASKLRSTLLPFTLPSHTFHLFADPPAASRISDPLPITLSLTRDTQSSKDTIQQPPVSLVAVTMTITPRTLVRCLPTDLTTDQLYNGVTGSLHQKWFAEPIVIAELKAPVLSLPERLDLSKHVTVIEQKLPPAFRTFNVSRQYKLRVVCRLVCLGETLNGAFNVENFTILDGDVGDARVLSKIDECSEDEDEEGQDLGRKMESADVGTEDAKVETEVVREGDAEKVEDGGQRSEDAGVAGEKISPTVKSGTAEEIIPQMYETEAVGKNAPRMEEAEVVGEPASRTEEAGIAEDTTPQTEEAEPADAGIVPATDEEATG